MKILFVNAPFVRYKNNSPERDPKIRKKNILLKIIALNQKLKIPLITSIFNHLFVYSGYRFGVRAGSRWPWSTPAPHGGKPYPFIMGYAASYLKSKGFEVNIIDAILKEQFFYDKFLQDVKKEKADIVVIECSTPTIDIDLWMAKEISKFSEVALAGPHLVGDCTKIQKDNPQIKYFLKGEYILSSLKMAKTRKRGIYESEIVDNLDNLPYPFRKHSVTKEYYDPMMPTKKPKLWVYANKGCPFRCSFCLWPPTMFKRKFSLRDPKKIAEEIRYFVKKHGYRSVIFDDDTFNIGNERISELCDELKKIGIEWTMMGRLDTSPNWLFDKMVDSGCKGMRLGVETFDQKVLENINKGLERNNLLETVKYLSEKHPKLRIRLLMMKDLPGQTEEGHKKDMKILKRMGYSPKSKYRNFQVSNCSPFPGTDLHQSLVNKGFGDLLNKTNLYNGAEETVMKEINTKVDNWDDVKK